MHSKLLLRFAKRLAATGTAGAGTAAGKAGGGGGLPWPAPTQQQLITAEAQLLVGGYL